MKTEKVDTNMDVPVKPNESSGISKRDYEYISELMSEMMVQLKYLRNTLDKFVITEFHLNSDTISDSLTIKKSDIPNMETNELKRFLTNHQLKDGIYNDAPREELEKVMRIVKDAFLTLATSEKEFNELQKDANQITQEYYDFINSVRVEEARERKINDLKEMNKYTEDEVEKKRNEEKIEFIENSYNFNFLKERLENKGKEETERICSIYFNNKQGSYMIQRYEDKVQKIKLSKKVYTNFFNIEEDFLPEEYHPFNNLFLCIYMDWLSHINIDKEVDKLYASSITGSIASLVYHKFPNQEKEDKFVDFIKSILDHFMYLSDYFIEHNASYKLNPQRVEMEKKAKAEGINVYRLKYKELGIEDKFNEDLSVSQLKEIYDAEVSALIEAQIKEYEEEKEKEESESEIDENANVSSVIQNLDELKEHTQDGLDTIVRKEKEAEEEHKKLVEAQGEGTTTDQIEA